MEALLSGPGLTRPSNEARESVLYGRIKCSHDSGERAAGSRHQTKQIEGLMLCRPLMPEPFQDSGHMHLI